MDERYSRQIVLEQIGLDGQQRLSKACIAVVGVGALGTIASELLARSGVGKLLLVDRDSVELHNLQRQTLYTEADVERPKALAAVEHLRQVNSSIELVPVLESIEGENVEALLSAAQVVVDCTDNFNARFTLNDYCVKKRKPLVYGSAIGTEGYVFSIIPGRTPCLECLFDRKLKDADLPACGEVGVLNSITVLVGAIQAAQALKLVLGKAPEKELQRFELWNGPSEKIAVERKKDCQACGGLWA